MFFASFKRIANSPLYQCVHYDNTRIIRLSQKQVTVVVVVVRKKCSKINSFFFGLPFFCAFSASEKEPTKNETMLMMIILALLLLFATPFSNEFGGVVGVHGFYLPGVAPQGTIFLRLFVCFVCSSSRAERCEKATR
jgi:hypothetical protein